MIVATTLEAAVSQAETIARFERGMFVVFDNFDGGTAPVRERYVVVPALEPYRYRGTIVHVTEAGG